MAENALELFGNLAPKLPERRRAEIVHVDLPSKAVVKARRERLTPDCLPADKRAEMTERLLFCREVHDLVRKGAAQEDAVTTVSLRLDSFAGLREKRLLTVRNYRNWMKKLGKHTNGRPNWDNRMALADTRGLQLQERAGAPEFWGLYNTIYCHPNQLSYAAAYRKAAGMWRRARRSDADVPTLEQVRYWYNTHADPTAVALARFGEEYVRNHHLDHIRRDWSNVQPNDVWVGDHHIFDAAIREWDAQAQKWVARRPWLTAWVDGKTGYFVGWIIRLESPDSLAIMDALITGIRANGNRCPRRVQSDRGKDYLVQGFSTPYTTPDGTEHMICRELGISTIHSIAYNARAKVVERWFGEVTRQFCRELPMYLGNTPDARPEVAGYFWDNPQHLPSLQQFVDLFAMWLEDEYHAKPQDGKILEGKSPAEAWTARNDVTPQISDEQLWRSMLFPVAVRKVGPGAVVRLAKREWQCDALWPFVGRSGDAGRVLLKVDRFQGHLFAYTLDGRLLGPCEQCDTVPALADTDEERALIGEKMAAQRKRLKMASDTVDDYTDGRRGLAVADLRMLEDPTAAVQVKSVGNRRSVKGASHSFRLLTATQGDVSTGFAAQDPPAPTPRPQIEEEPPAITGDAAKLEALLMQQFDNDEEDDDAW